MRPEEMRAAIVEAMARAIWETWSNSDQAKPDVRGLSWDGLLEGAADGMKAGIRLSALAREEAAAALTALESKLSEIGAKITLREHPKLDSAYLNTIWRQAHDAAPLTPWLEEDPTDGR